MSLVFSFVSPVRFVHCVRSVSSLSSVSSASPVERQERQEGHGEKQHGPSDQLRPCKFGSKCNMGVRCGFLHLPSDFLPHQGGRRN